MLSGRAIGLYISEFLFCHFVKMKDLTPADWRYEFSEAELAIQCFATFVGDKILLINKSFDCCLVWLF